MTWIHFKIALSKNAFQNCQPQKWQISINKKGLSFDLLGVSKMIINFSTRSKLVSNHLWFKTKLLSDSNSDFNSNSASDSNSDSDSDSISAPMNLVILSFSFYICILLKKTYGSFFFLILITESIVIQAMQV